jgi:transcriptional regulator of acetoin/glycerol metabolism
LFGITVGALVDHFRAPLAAPLHLETPTGRHFVGSARFNWPVWHATVTLAERFADPWSDARTPSAGALEAPAARARGLDALRTGDMQVESVIEKITRILNRDIPVLIVGETGTGKDVLARAIHNDSSRAAAPFVTVSCASIPESLIEAELFGYEDGTPGSATHRHAPGKIAQAHGGTLFLDEVGDMPLALQNRLLRVLQSRQVMPLGASKAIAVDFAIVSATHRNLREMVERGTFRDDLFYRLNGLAVRLPALRNRTDLRALVQTILRAELGAVDIVLEPDVERLFADYRWPGNLRQLKNVLRTACVMAAGAQRIARVHLPDDFVEDAEPRAPMSARSIWQMSAPVTVAADVPRTDAGPGRTLEEQEIEMIRQALAAADGNISVASKRLGISRNTIYRKLRWKRR